MSMKPGYEYLMSIILSVLRLQCIIEWMNEW